MTGSDALGVSAALAGAVVLTVILSPNEKALMYEGLALQLIGLAFVLLQLLDTRVKFGLEPYAAKLRRMFGRRPVTVFGVGASNLTMFGSGFIENVPPRGTDLNQILLHLEARIDALKVRIDFERGKSIERDDDLQKQIENLREVTAQQVADLHNRLKNFTIGDIGPAICGVLLTIAGSALSTGSEDLARILAR